MTTFIEAKATKHAISFLNSHRGETFDFVVHSDGGRTKRGAGTFGVWVVQS